MKHCLYLQNLSSEHYLMILLSFYTEINTNEVFLSQTIETVKYIWSFPNSYRLFSPCVIFPLKFSSSFYMKLSNTISLAARFNRCLSRTFIPKQKFHTGNRLYLKNPVKFQKTVRTHLLEKAKLVIMGDSNSQEILAPLQKAVKEQVMS